MRFLSNPISGRKVAQGTRSCATKIISRQRIFSICQPCQIELCERHRLVSPLLATLIETTDMRVRGNTEIGIRRGTRVQDFAATPTLTLIVTDTNRHPLATRAGGVRE